MIIDKIKSQTRWDDIPQEQDAYRLLCSDPQCSLSCANLRKGRLSVTSMHGAERHSYLFTNKDMAFAMFMFLNNLDQKQLENFAQVFNKISEDFVLELKKI